MTSTQPPSLVEATWLLQRGVCGINHFMMHHTPSFTQRKNSMSRARWLWPAYLGTLAMLAVVIIHGAASSGYSWNWTKIPGYIVNPETWEPGPLLEGLWMTLKITGASFAVTALVGIAAALGTLFGGPVIRILARLYLEVIRNTPLMVQIFIVYFVLGPVLNMDRFWAAVLALSLFEGAYLSEIIRSGILAIPLAQWQSSWTLGLSTTQTLRYVILPQTIPMLMPSLVNLFVSLIKDSALVSTIAIYDLTMQAQILVSRTFSSLEIWLVVAFMYGSLALLLSRLGTCLERKIPR